MTEAQVATHPRIDWTPPQGALGRLTAAAGVRAAALAVRASALEAAAAAREAPPSFRSALEGQKVAVIAELKRRSPSRGLINGALDIAERSRTYTQAGASALSVLTEPDQFGGSLGDLTVARDATRLPLLRKDFIVDRLQLLEARAAGAAAVLLIARALAPTMFTELAAQAGELGLDVLLEVRDESELELALRVASGVIGINNRNLETLEVDDIVSRRLLPRVPPLRITVYESGISDRAGVMRAAELGADAVLVGSLLSASHDAGAAMETLTGVSRRSRDP